MFLPKWVLQDAAKIETHAEHYLQRYPHYYLVDVKDGFAICKTRI